MIEEEMEGPISFWGYEEQESNLILPEHDDDDEIWKTSPELNWLKCAQRQALTSVGFNHQALQKVRWLDSSGTCITAATRVL